MDTVDLLRDLAAKLGQSMEALWPKAVRYVVVDGVVTLVFSLVLVCAMIWMSNFIWRKTEDRIQFEDPDLIRLFGIGTCVVIGVVGIVCFFAAIPAIIEPTGYLVTKIVKGR